MICQHCQTEQYEAVILDDDYRCGRCGRRVRSTPARTMPSRFPVETGAAARAYEIELETTIPICQPSVTDRERVSGDEQRRLFEGSGSDARVVAFDSYTSRAERQSIHARAAGLSRPAPLKAERIQVKHARSARSRAQNRSKPTDQRRLEFDGQEDVLAQPQSSIICDAPVAPTRLRLEAAMIDAVIVAIPCCLALALFLYCGGTLTGDKLHLPLLLAGLATIPLFYKFLWTLAGCDSIGMQRTGLQLVDFDGNPPSMTRRYQRLAGSLLSLFAAGIGLIWSLVDEDRLTWHDHISNTFPTFDEEL